MSLSFKGWCIVQRHSWEYVEGATPLSPPKRPFGRRIWSIRSYFDNFEREQGLGLVIRPCRVHVSLFMLLFFSCYIPTSWFLSCYIPTSRFFSCYTPILRLYTKRQHDSYSKNASASVTRIKLNTDTRGRNTYFQRPGVNRTQIPLSASLNIRDNGVASILTQVYPDALFSFVAGVAMRDASASKIVIGLFSFRGAIVWGSRIYRGAESVGSCDIIYNNW